MSNRERASIAHYYIYIAHIHIRNELHSFDRAAPLGKQIGANHQTICGQNGKRAAWSLRAIVKRFLNEGRCVCLCRATNENIHTFVLYIIEAINRVIAEDRRGAAPVALIKDADKHMEIRGEIARANSYAMIIFMFAQSNRSHLNLSMRGCDRIPHSIG